MSEIRSAKAALRAALMDQRRAMAPGAAEEASAQICNRLQWELDPLIPAGGRLVMGYFPTCEEASGLQWLRDRLAGGDRVALPRVLDESGLMEACVVESLETLQPGRFQIPAPDPSAPIIQPAEIDLCLVPGVGFDRTGRRLGRGGGYYDRFLRLLRPECLKVALAFEWQIVHMIPSDGHDIVMDWLVSEQDVYRINAR